MITRLFAIAVVAALAASSVLQAQNPAPQNPQPATSPAERSATPKPIEPGWMKEGIPRLKMDEHINERLKARQKADPSKITDPAKPQGGAAAKKPGGGS